MSRHDERPSPRLADELMIDAEPEEGAYPQSFLRHSALLLLGLLLVALNLRPALSGLSPLLAMLSTDLGLTGWQSGLVTTLPVLCLGLFAPLAPRLARRLGSERTVLAILLLLAGGIVLRSLFGVAGLFLGSLCAGAAIGIIGVLLPGIVKREFPRHAGALTGVYTMVLCLGAALAAGAAVPLARAFDGWRPALAFWCLPALLAALAWLPQLRARHAAHAARQVTALWRDPLAWQVTLYMGSQSSLAYIVFGWLPAMLAGRGLGDVQAGLVLSVSILVQLISALSAPWLATRGRDQRLGILVVMGLTLGGLLGCLYAPLGSLWLWAVLLGLGQGGTFSLALALIVLRTPDPQTAASLSGMAQGVGYTLAAFGPLAVGVVHDQYGWGPVGLIFIVIALIATVFGLGAGRARLVGASAGA